jgi:hypothetical protein
LYAYFLFYAVHSRKFAESPIVLDNDAHILNKTDAPQILAILDRAAKAVGCEKPVVPVLSPQCDASVAQDKDKICILIGLRLLYILSEEELYCVFLHELAHVSPEHRALHAMATYHIGMMNQGENQKGIYRIVDSRNGRVVYIGKTETTFDQRWRQHRDELTAGCHHCVGLQTYLNEELGGDLSLLSFEPHEDHSHKILNLQH